MKIVKGYRKGAEREASTVCTTGLGAASGGRCEWRVGENEYAA